jgi:asparagine synthase (glutamine-hydrolysing)
VAYNYLKKRNRTLNTFSFDFSENDIYFKANSFQPERDKPFVDMMLEIYPTNHTYLECNNENLYNYLFKAVDAKDLPNMADVESSLLYFCEKVKSHNKVALTGECADEIFGGYPWFHNKKVFDTNNFPWTLSLEPRKILLKDEVIKKLGIDEYSHYRYEESIAEVPVFYGDSDIEKRRREISYLNLKWFMQTLLRRMDSTSMHCGLEARVPFADHRIIEYLWNVPWKFKCPGGVVKGLLRDAFSDLLPKRLVERKKSPYPKTYNPKYEKILRRNFIETINDSSQPVNALIDKSKAEAFLKKPSDYSMPWFGQLMASPQLMAYMLQVNYWLKKYNLDTNF